MKKLLMISLTACLVYFVSPAMVSGQFMFNLDDVTGQQAPDFSLPTLNSNLKSFHEFRDGNNAIVFFWATWCPHCRKQLKSLNEAVEQLESKNIKLAIVDLGEDKKVVEDYVKRNRIKLDMFLDSGSTLSEPYGLIGVPTFYFVGKDGVVKDVLHELPNDLDNIFTQ